MPARNACEVRRLGCRLSFVRNVFSVLHTGLHVLPCCLRPNLLPRPARCSSASCICCKGLWGVLHQAFAFYFKVNFISEYFDIVLVHRNVFVRFLSEMDCTVIRGRLITTCILLFGRGLFQSFSKRHEVQQKSNGYHP